MSDILTKLTSFIEATNHDETIWGRSDCTAWPAQWVELVHGRSLSVAPWSNREEAHARIEDAGSLVNLWSEALREFGLDECYGDPRPGDVGIIKAFSSPQVGGIFMNHGLFVWRGEPSGTRMLLPRRKTIVKVWSIQ